MTTTVARTERSPGGARHRESTRAVPHADLPTARCCPFVGTSAPCAARTASALHSTCAPPRGRIADSPRAAESSGRTAAGPVRSASSCPGAPRRARPSRSRRRAASRPSPTRPCSIETSLRCPATSRRARGRRLTATWLSTPKNPAGRTRGSPARVARAAPASAFGPDRSSTPRAPTPSGARESSRASRSCRRASPPRSGTSPRPPGCRSARRGPASQSRIESPRGSATRSTIARSAAGSRPARRPGGRSAPLPDRRHTR